ncbi:biotin/lipoyl-containing protein [Dialister micraerophilus]|uniref:biotin/lipoyl-containing protein n=1 Tax=Dialister micraerophilus TaxID=309120 RepID=UPI0023F49647|nr:biotin/lipoyl-containing protein [Dialister micraerophilus]
MRKFSITVNGQTYEVEVSEIKNGTIPQSPVQVQQASAPMQAQTQTSVPKPETTAGDGEPVTSPMPGKVVYVSRTAGEKVEEGDEILVLEAMKMGNPIIAPKNGTITSMNVKEGQNVQGGDLLFTIK